MWLLEPNHIHTCLYTKEEGVVTENNLKHSPKNYWGFSSSHLYISSHSPQQDWMTYLSLQLDYIALVCFMFNSRLCFPPRLVFWDSCWQQMEYPLPGSFPTCGYTSGSAWKLWGILHAPLLRLSKLVKSDMWWYFGLS